MHMASMAWRSAKQGERMWQRVQPVLVPSSSRNEIFTLTRHWVDLIVLGGGFELFNPDGADVSDRARGPFNRLANRIVIALGGFGRQLDNLDDRHHCLLQVGGRKHAALQERRL